ncbi:MAG: HAMP domain-containing histidine kinase [Intestinimonas sp.]|nr:HAMP domain-containing histidine kinase [Intestinimonas sp.]
MGRHVITKSLYKRQFIMMAAVILLSFLLLGAAFITLSYRYTVQEKQDAMDRNVQYMASFTSQILSGGTSVQDQYFQTYVSSVAMVTESHIILCNTDGQVIFDSTGAESSLWEGAYLPRGVTQKVLASGSYSAMSDLGGLYQEKRYVSGAPISLKTWGGVATAGMVFVTEDTSSITGMWRAFATIFFFTAVVVLLIAFITSSVTSLRQTRPLKDMAEAVRKFGHGEFDTRVTCEHGRCDELGELADAFNVMAETLSQSEARRSEFVANISHELKTPMTTIAGFADGILDGTIPPERQREYLKVISSETRRLSRLVRRMLDLSRLQSTEHVTPQEQFDISEVMLRVLVSLENKVNDRHLDVDTDLPEGPVQVWGDPDAITQVCYNLLDNAIKFSNERGVLGVAISTRGGKAVISVRNEGETIPPEELPLLFDRFHKTDRSRSEDRDGVGLGLYIVKTILNNHKENITVISENGVTEFTFTLTLA